MFREQYFVMPGKSSFGFRYKDFPGGGEPDEPTYHQESRVIGHKYYVGVHMIVSQGPVDKFTELWVGEDWKVWEGTLTDGSVFIDDENLFGGEKKSGGIKGTVRTQRGFPGQGRLSYLQDKLGSDCPAFRWLSGIVLDDMYFGTSTYPKPWGCTIQRITTSWNGGTIWNSSKATIGLDMNPIHIIYEVMISDTFGKGLPTSAIDQSSFLAAADTLYNENFGLSYLWSSDEDPDSMIAEVLSTINGVLYQNMQTGKYEVALARKDYTVGSLPLYDEDDIIEITEFSRPSILETPNWVVVKYHDRTTNKDRSVTAHNLAMMDRQENIISVNVDYPGVCDSNIAHRLAGRELRQFSSLLATVSFRANRNMASVRPNDMIKISWDKLGIVSLPLRVITVNYGSLSSGELTFNCMEDVFSAGKAIYDDPEDTLWTEPWNDPIATTVHKVEEMTYGTIIDYGVYAQSRVDNGGNDEGVLMALVAAPTSDSIDYLLQYRTSPTANFVNGGNKPFMATAVIDDVGGLAQSVATATINYSLPSNISKVADGTSCLIGDEWCEMVSIDTTLNQITVKRGMWDTVPQFHVYGTRIWFLDSGFAPIRRVFRATDTPGVRPIPRTTKGSLAEGSAAIITPSLDSRAARPYPPINFKINSSSYPASFSGEPTLTWSHHNRKTSLGKVITANENPGHSLEIGSYYTLKIYDGASGGGLLRTETPLTGTTYTYTLADETSDAGYDSGTPAPSGYAGHDSLRFVLSCHRLDSSGGSAKDSWTNIDYTVPRV